MPNNAKGQPWSVKTMGAYPTPAAFELATRYVGMPGATARTGTGKWFALAMLFQAGLTGKLVSNGQRGQIEFGSGDTAVNYVKHAVGVHGCRLVEGNSDGVRVIGLLAPAKAAKAGKGKAAIKATRKAAVEASVPAAADATT